MLFSASSVWFYKYSVFLLFSLGCLRFNLRIGLTSGQPFFILCSGRKCLILLRIDTWKHLMAALLLSWEHLWRFSVFKVHRRAWVFKYIALLLTNIAKLRTGAHLFLDKLCLIAIISFYSMLCIHKFLSFMLVFLSESFIFDCRQVYKTLLTDVLIYRWNPKRSNTYARCYFTWAIVRLQIQFLCLNKQRSTICFMQRKMDMKGEQRMNKINTRLFFQVTFW